jgi:two-component system phosphate regulon response regulator PhoB
MKKILIIQDSALINMMLRSRLEPAGFVVESVESGEEGIEKLKNSAYQLVILDVKLPGMSGEDVCRILKSQDSTRHIPVLFLSAQDETRLSSLVAKMGAQGYIPMPFEAGALLEKINSAINKP